MFKKISIALLLFTLSMQSIENETEEVLRSKKCEHFCCINVSGNQNIGGNLTVGGTTTTSNVNLGNTNAGDVIVANESIAALFDEGFFSFALDQAATRAASPTLINPGDSLPMPTTSISSGVKALSSTQFSLPRIGTYNISAVISIQSTDGNDTVDPMQFSVRINGTSVPFTVVQNNNAQAQLVINNVLVAVPSLPGILDIHNTGTVAYYLTQATLHVQRISNVILVP